MSKVKNFLCILLVCAMVIVPCSVLGSVSAQTDDTEPLKVEVTTDKSSYKTYGIAEVTVKITNVSDRMVNNIFTEARFNMIAPVGKDSVTFKEVGDLQPGESDSYSYRATLDLNKVPMSFFNKLILWFVRLFNGGYTATEHVVGNNIKETTDINFGGHVVENVVWVGYDSNININMEMYNTPTKDNEVKELENGLNYVQNELLIGTVEGTTEQEIKDIIKPYNGIIVGHISFSGDYQIKFPNVENIEELQNIKNSIEENNIITYAILNYVFEYTPQVTSYNAREYFVPSDPYNGDNWNAFIPWGSNWGVEAVYALQAWTQREELRTINIGIIDSMFDVNHQDLSFAEVWNNPNNVSELYLGDKNNMSFYHGTHVAGIFASRFDNGRGVSGIYPNNNANLYAYAMHGTSPLSGLMDWKIALGKMILKNVKVINISMGSEEICEKASKGNQDIIQAINLESEILSDYLKKFLDSGFDFVICQAAGNENEDKSYDALAKYNHPLANIKEKEIKDRIIVVGSARMSIIPMYSISDFSNVGDRVDVMAPGEDIYSTKPNNEYDFCSGTSMASPIVAGIAAMIWAANNTLSGADVKWFIENTTVNSVSGTEKELVNAYSSLNAALNVTGNEENQNQDKGQFIIDVKNTETKQMIPNAWVSITSEDNTILYCHEQTDVNGEFSAILPKGKYNVSIYHSDYIEVNELKVEIINNQITMKSVLLTPIPTSCLMGTVLDKTTKEPVEDASILLRLLDDVSGQYTAEYVCSTDENGKFEIELPVGTYTYQINKMNLFEELYETVTGTITVDNVTGNIIEVHLTPKNLPDTPTDEPEEPDAEDYGTLTETGSCGDNAFYDFYEETGTLVIRGTGEMEDYQWSDNIKVVIIKNGITSIADDTFRTCDSLTSVTLPNSLKTIGSEAFYGCDNLTNITLSDGLKTIGSKAFSWCTSITSITIPDSVTSIGEDVFNRCDNLANIRIGSSVTSIGDYAFSGCSNLTSITVDAQNIAYSSNEYGVLFNKDKTKLIKYPIGNTRTSYKVPDSVISIDNYAFYDCDSLTSVTISDNVTSIGDYAFYDCDSLTSVTISDNVTSIGDYAFSGCDSLVSITIGDNVADIGRGTFYDTAIYMDKTNWENNVLYIGNYLIRANRNITGAYTIKEGTKAISADAFFYCTGLTSIIIPDSVTSIGEGAFSNCTNLTSIDIPDNIANISYHTFENTCLNNNGDNVFYVGNYLIRATRYTTGSYSIKEGTKVVADDAFSYCDSLTSVTIPDSVTIIGNGAFSNCGSLTSISVDTQNIAYSSDEYGVLFNKNKTELIRYPAGNTRTSYVIPDTVTSIREYSFYNCNSLTNVTIGNNVDAIGRNAFLRCGNLTNITIPNSVIDIGETAFYECSSLASITIPDSVTSIGIGAFELCTSLKSVIIGSNVETIGNSAFRNCDSITNITIPDSVTNIGGGAFYDCFNLTNVTIGSNVETIGNNAFSDCSALTSIVIPDSVTDIGVNAFIFCKRLKRVTIGSNVETIGNNAFYDCEALANITIPNSVTHIGGAAFSGCISLTSITVDIDNTTYSSDKEGVLFNKDKTKLIRYPAGKVQKSYTISDSITSIRGDAFNSCQNLTSITIPNGITTILGGTFSGCRLASIIIPCSITTIDDAAFYNCSLTDVYYSGTKEQWNAIDIDLRDNTSLTNATIHYNS